ncbi:hypothetical protein PG985_008812 [Apiospora marii]|uniref:Uncharacterized protein n=1 Tax=Apiospora marii TaxID=335849 RepID=A0ABR1RCK1_9PEZI
MSTVAVETTLSSSTPVASQDTPITPPTPRPTQSTMATSDVTTKDTWERRDIAYLKSQEELEKEFQEVILGQELHCGATGHPCIIMDMSPNRQHALVTTISSFSSGPHNNYLPPWKQTWHRAKDPDRFRSFAGTDHYSASRSFLYLEGGRQFPKSRTAWVYAGWAHLVPIGALKPFLVNRGATDAGTKKLRLEMQSWIDLYGHQCSVTSTNNDLFNDAKLTPEIYLPKSPPSSPERQQSSSSSSSPLSASASPRSPRKQSPQLANSSSPKSRAIAPAPAKHSVYENVAGDFTNNLICQQTYQNVAGDFTTQQIYQQTYQMSLVYQQQTPQSHGTWAHYPQTQPQACGQYQYQQIASAMQPGQQLQATSYPASTGAYMSNTHFVY